MTNKLSDAFIKAFDEKSSRLNEKRVVQESTQKQILEMRISELEGKINAARMGGTGHIGKLTEQKALLQTQLAQLDETVKFNGRTFKDYKTFNSEKDANKFLEKNDGHGVIGEKGGKVYVAKMDDMGEEKKLDPVGKADADIDNDGDVDSSDEYLHKRRKAISKAMKSEGRKMSAKDMKNALASDKAKAQPKDKVSLKKAPWDMKEDRDLQENKALIKDYQEMKKDGKKDSNILDSLMSMPKYKKMSKDQMAKVIGDAKRKGIFKEEVELDEAKMSDADVLKAAKALAANGKDDKTKEFGQGLVDFHKENDSFTPDQVAGLQNIMKNAGFQMAKEHVELDEISKDLAKRYTKAAKMDREFNDDDIDRLSKTGQSTRDMHMRNAKRTKGINRAAKRMAKEHVELDEAIDPEEYKIGSEKSQFGGYRAVVKHKEKGTSLYTGNTSYKTSGAAEGEAEAYLKGYAQMGDRTATRYANDYKKKNKSEINESASLSLSLIERVELDEAKTDVYHRHMLKALGKSRLPKNHSYTSAIANNGDFVVHDGGGRVVGRIPKDEHDLK